MFTLKKLHQETCSKFVLTGYFCEEVPQEINQFILVGDSSLTLLLVSKDIKFTSQRVFQTDIHHLITAACVLSGSSGKDQILVLTDTNKLMLFVIDSDSFKSNSVFEIPDKMSLNSYPFENLLAINNFIVLHRSLYKFDVLKYDEQMNQIAWNDSGCTKFKEEIIALNIFTDHLESESLHYLYVLTHKTNFNFCLFELVGGISGNVKAKPIEQNLSKNFKELIEDFLVIEKDIILVWTPTDIHQLNYKREANVWVPVKSWKLPYLLKDQLIISKEKIYENQKNYIIGMALDQGGFFILYLNHGETRYFEIPNLYNVVGCKKLSFIEDDCVQILFVQTTGILVKNFTILPDIDKKSLQYEKVSVCSIVDSTLYKNPKFNETNSEGLTEIFSVYETDSKGPLSIAKTEFGFPVTFEISSEAGCIPEYITSAWVITNDSITQGCKIFVLSTNFCTFGLKYINPFQINSKFECLLLEEIIKGFEQNDQSISFLNIDNDIFLQITKRGKLTVAHKKKGIITSRQFEKSLLHCGTNIIGLKIYIALHFKDTHELQLLELDVDSSTIKDDFHIETKISKVLSNPISCLRLFTSTNSSDSLSLITADIWGWLRFEQISIKEGPHEESSFDLEGCVVNDIERMELNEHSVLIISTREGSIIIINSKLKLFKYSNFEKNSVLSLSKISDNQLLCCSSENYYVIQLKEPSNPTLTLTKILSNEETTGCATYMRLEGFFIFFENSKIIIRQIKLGSEQCEHKQILLKMGPKKEALENLKPKRIAYSSALNKLLILTQNCWLLSSDPLGNVDNLIKSLINSPKLEACVLALEEINFDDCSKEIIFVGAYNKSVNESELSILIIGEEDRIENKFGNPLLLEGRLSAIKYSKYWNTIAVACGNSVKLYSFSDKEGGKGVALGLNEEFSQTYDNLIVSLDIIENLILIGDLCNSLFLYFIERNPTTKKFGFHMKTEDNQRRLIVDGILLTENMAVGLDKVGQIFALERKGHKYLKSCKSISTISLRDISRRILKTKGIKTHFVLELEALEQKPNTFRKLSSDTAFLLVTIKGQVFFIDYIDLIYINDRKKDNLLIEDFENYLIRKKGSTIYEDVEALNAFYGLKEKKKRFLLMDILSNFNNEPRVQKNKIVKLWEESSSLNHMNDMEIEENDVIDIIECLCKKS